MRIFVMSIKERRHNQITAVLILYVIKRSIKLVKFGGLHSKWIIPREVCEFR